MKNNDIKEYDILFDDIEVLNNKELSISFIDEVKCIYSKATIIYLNYLKYNISSWEKRELVIKKLNEALLNKLQFANLSEIAKKRIINSINNGFIKFIDDIYIMDDNVLLKGRLSADLKEHLYLASDMIDINNSHFSLNSREKKLYNQEFVNEVMALFLASINNYLGPLLCNPNDICIYREKDTYCYNVPNLKISVSKSIKEICDMIIEKRFEPINIIATYSGKVYYLEMNVRNNYWLIHEKEESIWKFSDNFTNGKQYSKSVK